MLQPLYLKCLEKANHNVTIFGTSLNYSLSYVYMNWKFPQAKEQKSTGGSNKEEASQWLSLPSVNAFTCDAWHYTNLCLIWFDWFGQKEWHRACEKPAPNPKGSNSEQTKKENEPGSWISQIQPKKAMKIGDVFVWKLLLTASYRDPLITCVKCGKSKLASVMLQNYSEAERINHHRNTIWMNVVMKQISPSQSS